MPQQQQMSSFAKRLGAKVAEANEQNLGKPIDLGNRRLPAGIRDGVARLSSMYTKTYEDGDWKGEVFFRASAVVVHPEEHNGETVAGSVTSVIIPLCDQPAKQGSQRKAKTFVENYKAMRDLIMSLGIAECPYTKATDPTGQQTEAYWFAAMRALTDPVRQKTNPVYVSFSTRGWTPPATPQKPKPEEMVFEEWHGLVEYKQQVDPASGVTVQAPSAPQPAPMTPPPSPNGYQPPTPPSAPYDGPTAAEEVDQAELVAGLVDVAMDDPEGATQEGQDAAAQLEELAWATGWSKEQTSNAANWAAVGEMALNPPPAATAPPPAPSGNGAAAPTTPTGNIPAVGTRWHFAKRTKDGERLKNNKGEEFPPQEVEVTLVDFAAKTCTVKNVKDGKDVVDIRTKAPVPVKFEWLERLPY